jgi:protein-disulfide isomerase
MRILALFLLVFLPFSALAEEKKLPEVTKESLLQVLPEDHVLGNKDAPVTIIEYASLSCSHCADFYNEVFPTIKEQFIDTGKVKLVYRDFPLNKQALRASMLAQCSGERYFDFIKVLFKVQESWAYSKNFEESLSNIAKLGGMSGEAFDACMQNEEVQKKVIASYSNAAEHLEINGTPTFFINGKKYPAMGKEEFVKTLSGFVSAKN